MSIAENPKPEPEPADTPQAGPADASRTDAVDLGPHAPASPYPKADKAPESGGYEAPRRRPDRET